MVNFSLRTKLRDSERALFNRKTVRNSALFTICCEFSEFSLNYCVNFVNWSGAIWQCINMQISSIPIHTKFRVPKSCPLFLLALQA